MGAVSACREELGDRAPAAGSPVGKPAGTQVYNHKKKPDLGGLSCTFQPHTRVDSASSFSNPRIPGTRKLVSRCSLCSARWR